MDRITRAVGLFKRSNNIENKYSNLIGLNTNLQKLKSTYKYNSKNEIVL